MKCRIGWIMLLGLATFTGCEKLGDYYLGINQQPKLTEAPLPDGLNIFCVLRPDSFCGQNKSFAFVQQVWPALYFDDFYILHEAEMVVRRVETGQVVESINFSLLAPDTAFTDSLYRPEGYFAPRSGAAYRMECRHSDFPLASGTCVVPHVPVIVPGSLVREVSRVAFRLQSDSTTGLIDVYLVNDVGYAQVARLVPDRGEVPVQFELPETPQAGWRMLIYYYDTNLGSYYANSNTSLNFNKFRVGFTTLESGYGVFGALNYLEVVL